MPFHRLPLPALAVRGPRPLASLAAAALTLGAAGCTTPQPAPPAADATTVKATAPTATPTPTAPPAAATTPANSPELTVSRAWAMATPRHGMTAVFADVTNHGDAPVTLVAATTSASGRAELHRTVADGSTMQMRATASLTVPAGDTLHLAPGGDHIMVMDLTAPLAVGTDVDVTLRTSTGGTTSFTAVAKTFTGADEPYAR